MRCPICGAKMVQGQLCKYCGIDDSQVKNASNKKVSEYRKNDMSDLIHFTTNVPSDVSRLKLILYTIFLGLIGINHFYVKRNVRGIYSVLSTFVGITFIILKTFVQTLGSVLVFELIYELAVCAMGVNVIMWVFDILNVIFKNFKIPVVLADKENK